MKLKNQVLWRSLATIALIALLGIGSLQLAKASSHDFQQFEQLISQLDGAIEAAANWLIETHQNEDGGYTSFSVGAGVGPSDAGGTVDALMALAAAEADSDASLEYLRQNIEATAAYASLDGSTAGKAITSLAGAGADPSNFAGNDFVLSLTNHLSPTGQFGVSSAFNQSLAILGSAAAGISVPAEAYQWLIDQQETEGDFAGSWDDGYGTAGNSDSTATAILALSGADTDHAKQSLAAAIEFLRRAQLDSGGWEYGQGFGENANSSALVVHALAIAREDFYSESSPWAKNGTTPIEALLGWQGESGAFQADFGDGRFDDFFSTVQALPALAAARDAIEESSAMAQPQEVKPSESVANPTVVEESSKSDPAAVDSENEVETVETEESDGGFSICGVTLAVPLLLGAVLFGSLRRRRF